MIDNKTVHLNLPLPHESNLLTEDVPRLREAFESLDAHAAQLETELSEALTAALAAATDAAKRALWAGIPDKPVSFPPANHNHSFAELGDKPAAFPPATHGHGWDEVSGKPGSYPPETHEHDATYAPKTHNHAVGQITGTLPTSKGGTGNTSGNISGNATTATRLQYPRSISLTGAVAGSASFDGSNNISITTTSSLTGVLYSSKTLLPYRASRESGGMRYNYAGAKLPSGGTWAYDIVINGVAVRNTVGVSGGSIVYSAGGMSVSPPTPETIIANSTGNYWRVD